MKLEKVAMFGFVEIWIVFSKCDWGAFGNFEEAKFYYLFKCLILYPTRYYMENSQQEAKVEAGRTIGSYTGVPIGTNAKV